MNNIWLKTMNIFRYSCHQKPSRSFYINNYQLPVCARCTGMYVGYVVALLLFLLFKIQISIALAFILIVPCFIDGVIQLKTAYESTNLKRFISGLLCGVGYIYIIIYIIKQILNLFS